MFKKLEMFLFGQVFGRAVARLAVSAAAYLAAQAAGAGVDVNPEQLSAALIAAANAGYTYIKEWREKRALVATVAVEAAKP